MSILRNATARTFACLLFSLALAPSRALSQAPNEEFETNAISEPSHLQWYPQIFQTSGVVPFWVNGYLVRPVSQSVSGEANIPLHDSKGNLARQGRITYPGASRVFMHDASVTPGGVILAA